MQIRKVREKASGQSSDPNTFTGSVWSNEIAVGESAPPLHVVLSTFEPGARTAWHTHPFGQILIAVSGIGRVQLAGSPAKVLSPGDSVMIAPGERHWHGVAPDQIFSHSQCRQHVRTGQWLIGPIP